MPANRGRKLETRQGGRHLQGARQPQGVGQPQRGRQPHARQSGRRSGVPLVIGLFVLLGIVSGLAAFAVGGMDVGGKAPNDDAPLAVTDSQGAAKSDAVVMTLGGSQDTYVAKGEDYIESGCRAVEGSKNLTDSVVIEGSVDTSKVGEYEVTYRVTDSSGAQASKVRTVHVVDDMDKDVDGIPVLMYHYVYTEDDQPERMDTNYLLDTKLEEQLKWLTKSGYYYPSYQELAAYIDGKHSLPRKSVILTFDDGQKGFLKYGIPLLEKYEVPATSFIIANQSDAKKKIEKYASEYVTFQSHSYGCHTGGSQNIGRGGRIYDLSKAELIEDAKKATEVLGTNEAFAYPYGDVSDVAPEALSEAGYLCAFTIHNGRVSPGDDAMQLPRVRILGESALEGFKAQVLGEDY